MHSDVLAEAVEMVQRSGEEVTPYRVHQALRQLGDTDTSYQQVFDALQAEEGSPEEEDKEDDEEDEDGRSSVAEDMPLAARADDTLDEAEAALQCAQAQVVALEAQRPTLDEALAVARHQVIATVGHQLIVKEIYWRNYLPPDDPAVIDSDKDVAEAAAAFRQARLALEGWAQTLATARQQIIACQHALVQAHQDVYMQQQHPELWQEREPARTARDEGPALSPEGWREPGVRMRAKAKHEERLALIERQIAQKAQEAGVL